MFIKVYSSWASEVIQWEKALTAEPDNLNSVPTFHSLEGENISCPQTMDHDTCVYTPTLTLNKV